MRKAIVLIGFIAFFGWLKAEQPHFMKIRQPETFIPYHDFRLGVGAVLFEDFDLSEKFFEKVKSDKIIDFNAATYYRGMVYTNGIITGNYTYQVNPTIGIGVSASYCSFYNDILDAESNLKIGSGIRNRVAIYPLVRINWLKSQSLKCYSEIGFGLGLTSDSETVNKNEQLTFNRFVSAQVTLLGVSFGKKTYLYSNIIGLGNGGYFALGLGYHFDSKKAIR